MSVRMKLSFKPNAISSLVVVALAAVLILLAVLQYRGSREVSEATGARMKATLQTNMMRFRLDLHRELGTIGAAFQEDAATPRDRLARYAQQYASWRRTAPHPGLVANVFLLQDAATKQARFLRLDPTRQRFEPAPWPAEFARLQERLAVSSTDLLAMAARFHPPEEDRRRGAAPERRNPPGPPWMMDEQLASLVHAVMLHEGRDATVASGLDWLIIELDRANLAERTLPDLTERHFAGPDGLEYQVAVVSPEDNRVVYTSDPDFGTQGENATDAAFEIFGAPVGRGSVFVVRQQAGQQTVVTGPRRAEGLHLPRIEPLRYAGEDKDWVLVVKHRKGSLDAVVAGMRRRSLAISFGVLLVLAATMALIIVASQRAHRLAKLQMDFVTNVSHELRTPLAVISSAADNLADGVVDNPDQLTRYGKVIKKQAAQLARLVEQILLFAAIRKDRLNYTMRPLAVDDVVATALNDAAEVIHGAGFQVQQSLEPGLPPVLGDTAAISQCLQNLITNAVKYGGADRWIGVRAGRGEDEGHGTEVHISVEDHGDGISSAELQRIFEPFYRSPAATAAQIHGSGLGLALARNIAEALGGHLTAASEPGKGSCFTLHLRTAAPAEAGAAVGTGSGA